MKTTTVEIPFTKDFPAYFSSPEDDQKHPGLIVIHEVWGLNDHIKEVADRFAKQGYMVIAPDLLSETGIMEQIDPALLKDIWDPAKKDEAQKKLRAAMAPIQSPEFAAVTIEKLKACVDYLLKNEQVNSKVGVLGFCFGGTYSYALAASDNRINAAVPFYGHAPEPLDKIQTISCPIQAFYGEKDVNLINGLSELAAKMKEYHKNFSYTVYPDTGHAFFNNTNTSTYNESATEDSWAKSLEFLHHYLN